MDYYLYTVDVEGRNPLQVRDELLSSLVKGAIFDLDRIICEDQIKMAIIRTNRAEIQKRMIAKVWGIELTLHLAATHQISDALNLVGVSNSTTRIGMVRSTPGDYPPGIIINEYSPDLLVLYDLKTNDPCSDIISKGVNVVINHQ